MDRDRGRISVGAVGLDAAENPSDTPGAEIPEPDASEPVEAPRRTLLERLRSVYRGEERLVAAFWLYFALMLLASHAIQTSLLRYRQPVITFIVLIFSLLVTIYIPFAAIGVIRSAQSYEGRKLWAFFARMIAGCCLVGYIAVLGLGGTWLVWRVANIAARHG